MEFVVTGTMIVVGDDVIWQVIAYSEELVEESEHDVATSVW